MEQTRVGVRELKERLSQYLRRVKDGESLAITERGRLIGRIVPVRASPEDLLAALAETGMLAWDGGRLEPSAPVVRNRSDVTVADLLVEDRG